MCVCVDVNCIAYTGERSAAGACKSTDDYVFEHKRMKHSCKDVFDEFDLLTLCIS